MAKYFGCEFVFDSIPSRNYDLRIMDFQSSGVDSEDVGSEVDIVQKTIYRRSRPYFYGRSTNKNLEFDLTIGSADPISADDRSIINKWMLGRMDYLPFQIIQSDMSSIIFYVIFDKASAKYVGNVNRGMSFHGICRDPWGFEEQKTLIKTYSVSAIVNETWNFMNLSANSDYLKPTLSFTMAGIGTYLNLTNITDNSRIFSFTGLSALETMTVDNDREIISSSTGLMRMSNFNKKFFRLIPGLNQITIDGGITNLTTIYQFVKKA